MIFNRPYVGSIFSYAQVSGLKEEGVSFILEKSYRITYCICEPSTRRFGWRAGEFFCAQK